MLSSARHRPKDMKALGPLPHPAAVALGLEVGGIVGKRPLWGTIGRQLG